MTSAPTTPTFGGDTSTSSASISSTEVGKFVSGVVQQIGIAIKSPKGPVTSASPAKIIDIRSKCYEQLSKLKKFKESDLLSDDKCM